MPRYEERKYEQLAHRPPGRLARFVPVMQVVGKQAKKATKAVGRKLVEKQEPGINALVIATGAGLGSLGGSEIVKKGWLTPRGAATILTLLGLGGVLAGSRRQGMAKTERRFRDVLEKLGYGATAVGVSNLVAGLVLAHQQSDAASKAKEYVDEVKAMLPAIKELVEGMEKPHGTQPAVPGPMATATAATAKVSPLERARAQVANA